MLQNCPEDQKTRVFIHEMRRMPQDFPEDRGTRVLVSPMQGLR